MQNDITARELMRVSQQALLHQFLIESEPQIQGFQELPTEPATLRRTDAPIQITLDDGSQRIVLVEHQTNWETELPLRLIEYQARYWLKYKLPVDALVFLIRPNSRAKDTYENHALSFRYKLVRIWDLPAEEFLTGDPALLPLIPLRRNGGQYIYRARESIQSNTLFSPNQKTSLLTILYMYATIYNPAQAQKLFENTRYMMFDSPGYKVIQGEGIEIGIRQTKLETARRMLARGMDLSTVLEITELSEAVLQEHGLLARD